MHVQNGLPTMAWSGALYSDIAATQRHAGWLANDWVSTAGWAHLAVVYMTLEFCCGSVKYT